MAYATKERVRKLADLDILNVTDTEINDLIELADLQLVKDITLREIDLELKGDLNGTNRIFYTPYKPIADTNLDKTIDKNDIKIYIWKDETKEEVEVSSIDAVSGKIILTTAPPSTSDKITIDYSHYPNYIPDWTLLEIASSYLTAHYMLVKKKGTLPIKYSIMRLRITEPISKAYYQAYLGLLQEIRGQVGFLTEGED